MRVQYAIAIAVAAALLAPASMSSQTQAQTPAPVVLKKSAPPAARHGRARLHSDREAGRQHIVTTFQVKNMSATNAIVGLQISEFWYDKAGNPLQGTGDRQRLRAPLQPLDVATIILRRRRSRHDDARNTSSSRTTGPSNRCDEAGKQLKPGPNT